MIDRSVNGVEFICANTDAQALSRSGAHHTIQLGTSGLGAGSKPDKGRDADVHIPLCKAALRELRDREIRARFDEMTMEHHYSARQAVAELAGCYGIASRHVWRLLKQADKEPGTRPLN